MEMRIPFSRHTYRKSKTGKLTPLIGIENIRGAVFCQGSSRAETQKSASMVLESLQDNTLRLCRSMIATKYRKSLRIGIYVMSEHHT